MNIHTIDNFIYREKMSIVPNLIKNIIITFEKHIKEYKINDDFCYEYIDNGWGKIKTYLNNQIVSCLLKYIQKLKLDSHYIIDSLNNKNISMTFFHENHIKFCIRKYKYLNGKNIINSKINWNSEGYKMFNFIWFLNAEEKNTTIKFSKELTITPKNGEIIIFPHSWYFPCNIETQEDLIYIYGNINT